MTVTTHETEIIIDPDVPIVRIIRELTSHSLTDSFEGRDAFIASGMEQGVVEGYQRLDEVLAGG